VNGFARPVAREQSWLAYTNPVRPVASHVVDRNCGLLVPLGIRESRPTFDMPRWPVSRERVQHWLGALRLPGHACHERTILRMPFRLP